jgi:hypothetical protein
VTQADRAAELHGRELQAGQAVDHLEVDRLTQLYRPARHLVAVA